MIGYNEPGMMKMKMKSRRLVNLRVSPPRQRFELTGGATTAPEAQYDMR